MHCAIDDHTRLAYAEIHPDETGATCAAFLRRAAAWFATCGITRIEWVLTDNALAYRRSTAWRHALADLGATAKFTRPYRPQTNGKAERFNRTLIEEWGYRQVFDSSAHRTAALPEFLHTYNMHRAHTALGGRPPISRAPVNNLTGHYTQVHTMRGHRLHGSMGRVGACADSAAMESVFALPHKNVPNRRRWQTREPLRLAIVVWIERTYHRRCRPDTLGRLTPIEFETLLQAAHAA